jgi:hypothetical protein
MTIQHHVGMTLFYFLANSMKTAPLWRLDRNSTGSDQEVFGNGTLMTNRFPA